MKWNIPGAKAPALATPVTKKKWVIPTSTSTPPVSTSTWQRTLTPQAKEVPKPVSLYNPAVLPTFNPQGKVTKDVGEYKKGLLTGLDYFNRYTETALGTLGAVAETAGFALDKDTLNILSDKVKQNYYQIWSPPALEEKEAASAVGRSARNILSLAGVLITTYALGKAMVDTTKAYALNARRIAYYGKKAGQIPDEIGIGGNIPRVASAPKFSLTAADKTQWMSDAVTKFGMTKAQAAEAFKLFQQVADTPYSPANPSIYGSAAKESGFAIGTSFQQAQTPVGQTVQGLPAGQSIILDFVVQHPDIAVKSGIIANSQVASQLSTLTKQVISGQVAVGNLQSAMTAGIQNLGVLAHYADLTQKPIEEAMTEQLKLAVPVGQPTTPIKPTTALAEIPKAVPVGKPQTVSGGIKPSPHRYQIPAQTATQPSPVAEEATTPPVSKMEIPSTEGIDYPEWVDVAARKVADAAQLKSPAYIRDKKISDDLAKQGIMRGSSLTESADQKEATKIWLDAYNAEVQRLTAPSTEESAVVQPTKSTKVVWSDWIQGVGERWTSGVGSGKSEKIELPVVYRIAKGKETIRQYNPSETAEQGTAGPWMTREATRVELKGDKNTYYLVEWSNTRGWRNASLIEAKSGMSAATAYSKTVKGARLSVLGKASEAIKNMKKTMGKTSYEEMLSKATQDHGEVANPMPTTQPTITNTAPLPAGQTSSTGEVLPTYGISNEPNLATSGTSQTIPADNESISRITVAFNKLSEAKKSKGIKKQNIDDFYQAMIEAKVPKDAIHWKGYHKIENVKSPEKQMAMVKEEVEKYNAKVLGEKIVETAHKREAKRAVKEAVALVKEQSEQEIAENGRILLEKAKKAVEGQKFGDQIQFARQKAHADAILSAMKQRALNQAKTIEWMKAEADRKVRQKAEVAALKKNINAVSMKVTPAEEARGIQAATAGVKGAEKIFEKPSSTQFAFLAEKKGLHVEQRPERPEPREVDLPELRKIAARVKALRDLGLEKKDAIMQARRESIEQRADAVTAQILTSVKPTLIPDIGKESHTPTRPNKAKELVQWIADAKGRKVWQFQELDGFKRGVITQTLYDDGLQMENNVRGSDRVLSERIKERLDKNGITEKSYNTERTLPNGQVLTQAQVLLVATNSLNTENLYHLMAGNGYSEETIAQAIQSMTPEEVDTANMILDDERGAWPAVNAAYEYTHGGESLPQLENFTHIELQHSDEIGQPEGSTAEELIHQDVIAQGWVQTASGKGWEKQRVPQSSIPLREDPIATYISYIKQTTDFINRERTAQDILQIVKDVHVKDAYMLRAGHEGYTSLLDYARDMANPAGALGLQAVAPKGRKFEKLLRDSRLASSCSILALRISKMVTAGASYVTSAGQVGLETMLYGTAKLISNPRLAMRTIKEFMPILYDRIIDPVRIEAEVSMLEKSWEKGRSKLRDWENVTFRIADTADIASEALGGLSRVQREHPDWTLEKCAYEVQRMALATHSSDIVEDKPDIYKLGEVARVLTAFTGEATAASDYLNYLGRGAFKGKIPKHRFFRQALFTIVGVALIMRLAAKVSQGRKKDSKEDMWYNTWWGYSLMSLIENTIPILGRYITQGLQGITWASAPVALKPLEVVKNIFAAIAQGNIKDVAGHVAELAGYLTAAPVEGVNEAIRWLTPPKTTQTSSSVFPSLPKRPSLPKPPRP